MLGNMARNPEVGLLIETLGGIRTSLVESKLPVFRPNRGIYVPWCHYDDSAETQINLHKDGVVELSYSGEDTFTTGQFSRRTGGYPMLYVEPTRAGMVVPNIRDNILDFRSFVFSDENIILERELITRHPEELEDPVVEEDTSELGSGDIEFVGHHLTVFKDELDRFLGNPFLSLMLGL